MSILLKKPAELLDRLSGVWPHFEFPPHDGRNMTQNSQARDDELIVLLTFLQENSVRTPDVSLIPQMRLNR
jgi:hypothetical protein